MLRLLVALLLVSACGDDDVGDASTDAASDASDAGVDAADARPDPCADFVVPERPDRSRCGDPDADDPTAFVECERGSGWAGVWTRDSNGLPAYDLTVEQRCDPAAQSWTSRREGERNPWRDPIHLVGNGRGVVAMAHASGAIEMYSQDRGHAWINRIDTWEDPRNPDYPPQIGGGFNYLIIGDEVRSNRFEDMPVGEALQRQTRRFGVGYHETVTTWDDVRVTRYTFANGSFSWEDRMLIAEVYVENLTDAPIEVGVVEVWDPNLHQVEVELATSDLLSPNITEDVDRRRRERAGDYDQHLVYDPTLRTIVLSTTAKPGMGTDRPATPSPSDWHPHDVFLLPLLGTPDAVWLDDRELFEGLDRSPPQAVRDGDASPRELDIDGAGQHAFLAMRVPMTIAPGEQERRIFTFGHVPEGRTLAQATRARSEAGQNRVWSRQQWEGRLLHAAFPGLEHAGAIQRELAWASYNALAHVTYDEYHQTHVLGQGGSYKYIHGLDGAIGDLCLFADSVALIDPFISRSTLRYAMSTQHASTSETPYRYPYATTGVGSFSDVGIYDQRSDAYWMVPAAVGRYVGWTRDTAFLDEEIPFWPRADGEEGTVREHLERGFDYADTELGFGARGMVAMGTGDYADGIHFLADEETTNTGTSSVYNALLIAHGFPLLLDFVDGELSDRVQTLLDSQIAALEENAWNGERYERAFMDSGNPLAPDTLFLEPQILPILAGLADADRTTMLLTLVADQMETDYGAMSTVPLGEEHMGGVDEPQIGGIWPIANAWLTEAYAHQDPEAGWDSFVRNTLMMHAERFPETWYGIWTGPDSYHGPDHERAGEADAHLATALTDYPALNVHVHTSPLRALMGLLGIEGMADGLRISPRVPTETFTVDYPELLLEYRPDAVGGFVGWRGRGSGIRWPEFTMRLRLPSALREVALEVRVNEVIVAHTVEGDEVVFTLVDDASFSVVAE